MAKPLTAIAIANLKPRLKRYEVSDPGCHGLRVVVFPSRKKSFIVRYRYRGLQCKLTLGPCLTERGVAESDIEVAGPARVGLELAPDVRPCRPAGSSVSRSYCGPHTSCSSWRWCTSLPGLRTSTLDQSATRWA